MLEPLGHIYDPTHDQSGTEPRFYNEDIVKGHFRPPRYSTTPFHTAQSESEGMIISINIPYSSSSDGDTVTRPTYSVASDVILTGARTKQREPSGFEDMHAEYGDLYIESRTKWRVPEEFLTLVRRGNFWKHFHNEPLTFSSPLEEGRFWLALGHVETVEIPRPRWSKQVPKWSRLSAIEALTKGTIDTCVKEGGEYVAYRFLDQAVGSRVREASLQRLDRWMYEHLAVDEQLAEVLGDEQ